MKKCLNCGNDFEETPGRRPKLYCSSKCRSAHYQKRKEKHPKYVQRETYERVLEENRTLKDQIRAIQEPKVAENKPILAPELPKPNPIPQKEVEKPATGLEIDRTAIEGQIKELEMQSEGCGKGVWGEKMREKLEGQIKELRLKLAK